MERIASELDQSTARISDLIKAIKEYSYMDQAPLQEVDIKNSLETTLTIMHHKLKRGILVTREFSPELPKVMAYGSWLGLDVVYLIVRKMRGVITVKSAPGDTRFQVRIPIQSAM